MANEKPTIWFGDIVTADIGSSSVRVIRPDGSGGFTDTPYVVVSGSPPESVNALATADFDGDGLLDVAAALSGTLGEPSLVGILYNNGAGGFDPVARHLLPGGIGPRSIAVADLDGVGGPDIVTANADSDNVTVLINGAGGIVSTSTLSVGDNPYDVALGDVNGDGNVDIVTANNFGNNVSLLLGNGDGTFEAQETFAAGVSPASVALGDVNGDGKVDIVVANNGDNTVSILLGDGGGDFVAGSTLVTGSGPLSVELGDLNSDGDLDIVTANFFGNTVSVLLSNGVGGFGPATGWAVGGDFVSPHALADVDGDGNLDIVAGFTTSFIPPAGAVRVLFGDGAGGFARNSSMPTGQMPFGAAFGHFGSTTIDEDATLTFAAANGNGIGLTDSDSAGGDETLTLSVAHGTLALASLAGLTSVSGDGTGSVTLTGSIAELNAAINGLVYTPDAEFSGADALSISLNDNGNSAGPAETAARTIAINVDLVNDVPTGLSFANRTAVLAENSSTAAARKVADIVVADPDGGNTLSLSGADAHLFQIVGTELRLKAGVRLDFETNAKLDVTVSADDPSTPGAPDVSTVLTINVTDVNEAPSLALTGRRASLAENVSTATARKVANIVITDDALGSEKLTLAGADAALFQIVGTELRLKAGVKLDFETNPQLDVRVMLNDLALPGIEDQVAMAIRILNVANELIKGTNRDDRLLGTVDADRIIGLAGADRISGGGGNDTITGGTGVDIMTGGAGADVFVFLSFQDSGPNQPGVVGTLGFVADQGLGKRDIITDFVAGADRIDLSAVDANTHIAGNQKFTWKGAAGFSFSAGELVYKTFDFAGTDNDQTIIYGDIDGNGGADFQIQLRGIKTLSAADFAL